MIKSRNFWKLRNFGIIFSISFTVSACTKSGGSEHRLSDLQSESEIRRFTIDDEMNDIAKSLEYSCANASSNTTTDTYDHGSINAQLDSCISKMQQPISKNIEFVWTCAQSDPEARPLPSKSSFLQTILLNKKDALSNTFQASYALSWYKSFLNPALLGDTNYGFCRKNFSNKMLEKIGSEFSAEIIKKCALEDNELNRSAVRRRISVEKNVLDELHDVTNPHFLREINNTLLNTIQPYYSTISETQESNADWELQAYYCKPRIPNKEFGNTYYELNSLQDKFDKNFIDNEFQQVVNAAPACAASMMEYYLPEHHIPNNCFGTATNKKCDLYLKPFLDMYSKLHTIINPESTLDMNQLLAADSKVRGAYFRSHFINNINKGNVLCEDTVDKPTLFRIDDRSISDHPVPGAFEMESNNKDAININVMVNFVPNCAVDASENIKISKRWIDRVNTCLERVDDKLTSSIGKKIKLRLKSDSSNLKKYLTHYTHSISVLNISEQIREHSRLYSPSTKCSVLIHEVLHLLGLVDEYKDAYTGNDWRIVHNNKCRILGPKESIMYYHEDAIHLAIKDKTSILKPAHFRFIAYPNCNSKNSIYYQCAKHTHKDTEKKNSAGEPDCGERKLPDACANDSLDWINI